MCRSASVANPSAVLHVAEFFVAGSCRTVLVSRKFWKPILIGTGTGTVGRVLDYVVLYRYMYAFMVFIVKRTTGTRVPVHAGTVRAVATSALLSSTEPLHVYRYSIKDE